MAFRDKEAITQSLSQRFKHLGLTENSDKAEWLATQVAESGRAWLCFDDFFRTVYSVLADKTMALSFMHMKP